MSKSRVELVYISNPCKDISLYKAFLIDGCQGESQIHFDSIRRLDYLIEDGFDFFNKNIDCNSIQIKVISKDVETALPYIFFETLDSTYLTQKITLKSGAY